MQVTVNARARSIAGESLAGHVFEERRSRDSDPRPCRDRIIRSKAALVASSIKSDKPSEAEAIHGARRGDHLMFDYLYRMHMRRVYVLCLRMLGSTTEAEDLTQEVFLLLLRKIHTFRGESAFSTWLYRLATNLVLMHLRKKAPPVISIEADPDPDENAASPIINVGVTDLLLEGSIDRINLERCIKQLPVGYRTMFVLHDIEGYRHKEIAEIAGRSVGVSKSQLHKARMRLRELLNEFKRQRARNERMTVIKLRSRPRELCSLSIPSVLKDGDVPTTLT